MPVRGKAAALQANAGRFAGPNQSDSESPHGTVSVRRMFGFHKLLDGHSTRLEFALPSEIGPPVNSSVGTIGFALRG